MTLDVSGIEPETFHRHYVEISAKRTRYHYATRPMLLAWLRQQHTIGFHLVESKRINTPLFLFPLAFPERKPVEPDLPTSKENSGLLFVLKRRGAGANGR